MSDAEPLRAEIEKLAPDRSKNAVSAVMLSDAMYALEAKFSQVLGVEPPREPATRDTLRNRCLELVRQWVPLLDLQNLKQLEARVKDRRMPVDLKARKAELKAAQSTQLPDRSKELAAYETLPPLDGFEPVAALYVEGRLLVGEYPEHGANLDARPGIWLAYFREPPPPAGDDDYPPQELIAVHADCIGRIHELRQDMEMLDVELPIHGARMAIADALAARDEDFVEALGENEEEVFRGRAAQVSLGGDGHGVARVQYEDERVVLVLVKLY